jgi:hypothetical protein
MIPVTAVVRCGHGGRVVNVASQPWVTVNGAALLVDADPERRTVVGCPNTGPTVKPCTTSLQVTRGYSAWVRIGGRRVVLSDLDGLTDGTVPGTVHYAVQDAGQTFVRADT